MGGRVGLKGTDGAAVLRRARELGAVAEAPRRAVESLTSLRRLKDQVELVTFPHEMGEDEATEAGFSPTVIGSVAAGKTAAEDTRRAAREMADLCVDLILFAGGDGTARDVHDAIGRTVLCIGIPAGVKIHSAVYAVTPRHAGELAALFLDGTLSQTREAEVMDIDEDAFRAGALSARLCGYLRVPEEASHLQSAKSGGAYVEGEALLAIAKEVVEKMDDGCLYIVGPGTTTRAIFEELGLVKTLLGVDVIMNKEFVAADVSESQLRDLTAAERAKIIVTVIGAQGYILGRGNQQISPEIVRRVGKENIIVVADRVKLLALGGRPLLVDTGDAKLDRALGGYVRVTTGFKEYATIRVGS